MVFIGLSAITWGQCNATYTWSVDGLTVTVNINASGATVPTGAILWGDGSAQTDFTANTLSASHTFAADGAYSVCIVYFDANNQFCQWSECFQAALGSAAGCTLDVNITTNGLTANVIAIGQGAGVPHEYVIDWGDGSGFSPDSVASHTYATSGAYNLCVAYTDPNNQGNCTVYQCDTVNVSGTSGGCAAQIQVSNVGNVYTVTITGSGATSPVYIINWGDGTQPTQGSTGTHTYTTSGAFTICGVYGDATNPGGCQASDCQNVDVTVGIQEAAGNISESMRIFPNPTKEWSQISWTSANRNQISIILFDLLGKPVMEVFNGNSTIGENKLMMDFSSLSSGIYFLRWQSGSVNQTVRFVKSN